jgi:hypothetical protein
VEIVGRDTVDGRTQEQTDLSGGVRASIDLITVVQGEKILWSAFGLS